MKKEPVLKIDEYGTKRYYVDNQLHREDGPAVEYVDGDKFWLINNRLHREDGPAEECSNGDKYWHYHGRWIECSSQEEFEKLMRLKAFW